MFARHVAMRLKPNMREQAQESFQNEVLPLMRKQKGFQHAFVLVSHDETEAIGISLWDNQADAEHYQQEASAEIQRITSRFVEGSPQVKTYEVGHSTIQQARSGAGH